MPSKLATELVGYAGGGVLAVSMVPQLFHVLKTKSTTDISYSWQVISIIGVALDLSYLIMVGATAGTYTDAQESHMSLILIMLQS